MELDNCFRLTDLIPAYCYLFCPAVSTATFNLAYSTICSTNGIKITVDQNHVVQHFPHSYIHPCYRQDIERDLIPERTVNEISQTTEIKDLYFNLLKSSKKEIMLIFPSNKAFGRHERIGIIGLIKRIVREKT